MAAFVPRASWPFQPLSARRWPLGGRSSNQGLCLFPHSVQTAVITVFKGGGLQSNELYALNENIRYVQARRGAVSPWA